MRACSTSSITTFVGSKQLLRPSNRVSTTSRSLSLSIYSKASLEFIRGIEETTIPSIRLTRTVDGSNGTAYFRFDSPTILTTSEAEGDITGLYMVDDEGVLQTVEVSAKFVNGKPEAIEAKYFMQSPAEWDRFLRFMERYSDDNGLEFQKVLQT